MHKKFGALFLFLALTSVALAAQQRVAGLNVNYEQRFQSRPEIARAIIEQQSTEVRGQVRDVEVFSASRHGEITEVFVIKTQYQSGAKFDIDGAALGAVENVKRLDGVSKATHTVRNIRVSGHDARQVSFEADSKVGRFGVEAVLILDRKTNTLWAVQCSFGRRGIPGLEHARKRATSVLTSVGVASK